MQPDARTLKIRFINMHLSKKKSTDQAIGFAVVLVTAPDIKTARGLAKAALQDHLVACANLVPGIESHYWWQAKLERSSEVLILFKTTKARLAALEKLILAKHPYQTPEFLSVPIDSGSRQYLQWLKEACS